jgi:hypothetical protein
VLLTYVDESYTDDWFAMAALLIDGPTAVVLTNELDRVAAATAKAYGLGSEVVLHGHEAATDRLVTATLSRLLPALRAWLDIVVA